MALLKFSMLFWLFYNLCLSENEAKCYSRVLVIVNANQSGIFLELVQKTTSTKFKLWFKVSRNINLYSDDDDDDVDGDDDDDDDDDKSHFRELTVLIW